MEFAFDGALIDEIAARFDLRDPNRQALEAVVKALVEDGATDKFPELVADLATGVGKTYLMSSLVDYAAAQGVRHVLVVTPGSVIQRGMIETCGSREDAPSRMMICTRTGF